MALAASVAQAREDLILPVRFWGPGFSFRLRYSYSGPDWELETQLHVAILLLKDRYNTLNGVVDPGLAVTWTHDMPHPAWVKTLRLGPTAGIREMLGYYGSWDDSHLYWLGMSYVGASGTAELPVAGRDLRLQLSLPIVALVSRPPRYRQSKVDPVTSIGYWVGRFAHRPSVTSWHELQAFRVAASWRSHEPGWNWEPYLSVDFLTHSRPRRTIYLTYWVGVELRR